MKHALLLLLLSGALLHASRAARAQPEPAPPEAETDLPDAAPEPAPAEPVTPAVEAEPVARRAVALQAAAGLGFGTLSFTRPTREGVQVLNETPFAATELLLRVRAWPAQPFSLDVLLAYQTSLGMLLQLAPLFALPQNVSVRLQRAELSAAPVFRLGDSTSPFALALPAGFAFQSLSAEEHQFEMPSYVLGGPELRGELLVRLGEIVQLRAGPEVQWIVLIASSLRERGACCQGFSLGGQAEIEASFGPHVSVALAYREAHSFVPVPATRFDDVQRFLMARIAGGL